MGAKLLPGGRGACYDQCHIKRRLEQEYRAARRLALVMEALSDAVLYVYRDVGFHISMTPEPAEQLQHLAAQGNRRAMMILCHVRVNTQTGGENEHFLE